LLSCSNQLISDREIWQCAALMIKRYKDDAMLEAAGDEGTLDSARSLPTSEHGRWIDMGRAPRVMLLPILLAACSGPSAPKEVEANRSGRCLYTVEIDNRLMTKWGSCSNPPAFAINRISD
jgi:hypothetical protein